MENLTDNAVHTYCLTLWLAQDTQMVYATADATETASGAVGRRARERVSRLQRTKMADKMADEMADKGGGGTIDGGRETTETLRLRSPRHAQGKPFDRLPSTASG